MYGSGDIFDILALKQPQLNNLENMIFYLFCKIYKQNEWY